MTCGDLTVDTVLMVSTVGGERGDRAIELFKQVPNLRGTVDVAGGYRRRCDLSSVGVHGDVQLAPRPPCLCAVLLEEPFARAAKLRPSAGHQQVHGTEFSSRRAPAPYQAKTAKRVPTMRDRHLQIIAERGRMAWQKASSYHWRALVAANISRLKRVTADGLRSRTDRRRPTQRCEHDGAGGVADQGSRLGQGGRPAMLRP